MNYCFKPKRLSVIVVILAFLVSTIFVIVISRKMLLLGSSNKKEVAGIIFASVFLLISLRAGFSLKTVSIENEIWTLRRILSGKTVSFHRNDIVKMHKTVRETYKFRWTIVSYTIHLKSGKSVQVSSDDISDFDLFERKIKGFVIKG